MDIKCNSFDNTCDLEIQCVKALYVFIRELGGITVAIQPYRYFEIYKLTNLNVFTRTFRWNELQTDPSNHSWYLWPRSLSRITKDQGLISERKHESLLSLLRKAAGPEIIQYQFDEIVTSITRIGDFICCIWNENNLKPLTRNYWRASLVPASAVIPAPRAYLKIVAVKTPVVECR